MKYLEYLGDLYYTVHKDFNGILRYPKKNAVVAFYYGDYSLELLKEKKIAVIGTGINAFYLTEMLRRKGISVSAYCENDPQLIGQTYHGMKIRSPFEIYGEDAWFPIAANDDEKFEAVTDQFTHCGVEHFGYFFKYDTVIDLKDEEIRGIVMRALNVLINNPYGPSIHKNAPLGITMRLLPGLEWWSEELYWMHDDIRNGGKHQKVLDIGPGFGFASMIVKLTDPETDLRWLNLALEDSVRETYIDWETKEYPIISYYGMIEDPAYRLDEKFDSIIMTEVFEHFAAAPAVTLKKIADMLNDGGRIYLSTPNWEKANFYASWRDIPPFHETREAYAKRNKSRIDWMDLNLIHTYVYREEEIRELFAECGLKVERYRLNDCNNFNFVLKKQDA